MERKELFLAIIIMVSFIFLQSCQDDTDEVKPGIESDIDQIVENTMNENTDPGFVLLIHYEGETVMRKAYGLASVSEGRKLLPETPCYIASLSKQFTAMAVMICRERGLVGLEQAIGDFFPEFPDLWKEITIHQLLTHQSGIPCYINDLGYYFDGMTNEDVLTYVEDYAEVNFQPGARYRYSNTGYIILAELVERISGKTLGDFCRDEIFSVLGMEHTFFVDEDNPAPADRAVGHSINGEPLDYTLRTTGDGGMVSTIDDMLRWNQGLDAGVLVSRQTLDLMMTPYADMKNGVWYGYGWYIDSINGFDLPSHDGGFAGIYAYAGRIEEKDFYCCLFGNSPNFPLFEEIIRTTFYYYFPGNNI